ncbi:hypothetical protein F5B17DRAFT_380313 [Nemania serpens]|nr:hypothetical protein F5B17DRAFT_380313 [Nemania serpens]
MSRDAVLHILYKLAGSLLLVPLLHARSCPCCTACMSRRLAQQSWHYTIMMYGSLRSSIQRYAASPFNSLVKDTVLTVHTYAI